MRNFYQVLWVFSFKKLLYAYSSIPPPPEDAPDEDDEEDEEVDDEVWE